MLVLKDHLYTKYGSKKERRVFSPDEMYLKTKDFLQEYPVIDFSKDIIEFSGQAAGLISGCL